MNRTTSLYLDLVRLLTALTVFLVHANYGRFTGGLPIVSQLRFLGNDGVMVFFVLSGFVIAYVADRREVGLTDYAVSRFARLYSVVAPAIALTIGVDYLGSSISPALYDGWWYQADNPVWRASANLLFVNELWFSSVRPFSNGPFWSMGFEFWYYVIFGAAYYLEGRTRYLAVGAAALIAGPKILMLFPVWLLGVWTYRTTRAARVPEALGWVLLPGSVAGYVLFQTADGPRILLEWTTANLNGVFHWTDLKWSFATPFLSCYVIGTLVALHFIGFSAVAHRFAGLFGAVARPIQHLAGFTFAIYLFHYPLLQVLAAVTGGIADPSVRATVVVVGTLAVVYALGTVTEARKADFKRLMLAACATVRGEAAAPPDTGR